MLEPRPESRTATRTLSAMKGRAPRASARPGVGAARNRAAALAFDDLADLEQGLAGFFQHAARFGYVLGRDDSDHADAAIEGPRHLSGLDIPLRLEEGHQLRLRPAVGVDAGVEPPGQDPRHV